MRYQVYMADADLSYLSKLELMLFRDYGDQIELHLITDSNYLDYLFASPQMIDILVISDSLWKEEYKKQLIPNLFFLNETETPVQTEVRAVNIYKYSSVQNVIHTIGVALKHLIKGSAGKQEKKIVLVYSPQGGCGKTTLAVGTANALYRLGNHVLYINAETIQTFLGKENDDIWGNRALISALSTGRFSKEVLEDNIVKGEVDYLRPLQYSLLANGIRDMHYTSLIHSVKELLPYDYIIVDTSSEFNDFKAQMIAMANQILIPCLQDEQGAAKMEAMLRNLNASDKRKYVFICNMYRVGEKNLLLDTPIWPMIHYKVPYRDENTDGKAEDTNSGYMEIAYSLV